MMLGAQPTSNRPAHRHTPTAARCCCFQTHDRALPRTSAGTATAAWTTWLQRRAGANAPRLLRRLAPENAVARILLLLVLLVACSGGEEGREL
jgi:hypothetical protein